ncbi:ATP-binding protein [Aquimarina sp. AD10]|uniref:histidine kinase n=1 Tax=Aquimarina aggregata TaxID=1642818 RepID=A0A162XBL0_9FLAO|nr:MULTISPECIES: tetratricopeptide repeat-containing sensor histidine kinase [Aquimarina]AXT60095.1 ATP-binding protein [Aquimarina sp. AD10]KZS38532.1 hypothetical protein AWE51_13090 [Aquimarina aggregata]RKN00112.1 ATP-binding protein [Aquimarina sp. AD10]
MKLWRVISFIPIVFGILFVFNSNSAFSQDVNRISRQKALNSIAQQYELSKQKTLPLSKRLAYVSSFLEVAYLYQQDSLIYNGLMQKTMLLGMMKNYDSAVIYSHKLYDLAAKNQDSFYLGISLIKLGVYHNKNNQLTEAFKYHNEAFKIYKAMKDSVMAGKSLLNMTNIQKSLGDYSGNKTTAIEGVKYLENTDKDLRSLSGLYHGISVANREQKNYEEALKYNEKALNLGIDSVSIKKIGQRYILVFKNTKANILASQGNYKEAVSILTQLESDVVVRKSMREYARVIGNLGYVKWLQNPKNTTSEKLLLQARSIRDSIRDVDGLIASNIHLTKYYLTKNKEKALQYAEAAYQNAKELNSLTSILESLGFIFQLQSDSNEEAKVFHEVYIKLQNINQSNREIYAVTKYENDKLTNENLILKAETAKKERQKVINLLGTLILILVGGLVFYLFRQRHKREKIRDVFNAETRISKRIHDELANDVYNVMTQIQNNQHSHDVLDKLENIYNRTRDISRENNNFDTGTHYSEELGNMLSSYSTNETKIIIKDIDIINWQSITPEKKIITHRIIQELMVNMKKHSHAALVAVSFRQTPKNVEITYADTGIGVDKNEIIFSSGLRNAENRIKIIGGSFIFDSEKGKGFKANICFPN